MSGRRAKALRRQFQKAAGRAPTRSKWFGMPVNVTRKGKRWSTWWHGSELETTSEWRRTKKKYLRARARPRP